MDKASAFSSRKYVYSVVLCCIIVLTYFIIFANTSYVYLKIFKSYSDMFKQSHDDIICNLTIHVLEKHYSIWNFQIATIY